MTARAHLTYLAGSGWTHLRPARPFLPRADWFRIGGGVVLAGVAGWLISLVAPEAAVLVNVGSFVGALVCVLPGHHNRVASVTAGLVLIDGGAIIGVLLRDLRFVVLVPLFFGLFVAGMARTVSVGAYMRLLFGSIVVPAAAELSSPAASDSRAWQALGAVAVGELIVAICACVGRPSRVFSEQRESVAELYRQLIALAGGGSSRFARARTLARESLELIVFLQFADARWLRTLVDAADEIAANVAANAAADDRRALQWVLDILTEASPQPLPDRLELSPGVALAVSAARGEARSRRRVPLGRLRPSDTIRFYGRELRDLRGSSFRFASRVALTGLICQVVGQFFVENLGNGLRYHGFWTLLAGCLMAMPDYHGTSGKVIARTTGSVLGAVLGTALSLIPFLQHGAAFAIVITVFVFGYLAARTISQGVLMVVVVGWLAFLLGGEPAAFTRTIDTIVGAVIAAVVFFILPTWNVDRLRVLFQQWCVQGRSALSAAVADTAGAGHPEEARADTIAITDLAHAQRRFARAAAAVPLEPRKDESPWPVADLPRIADTLDTSAVAILQLRRWPDSPAGDEMSDEVLVESFGEWFNALAAGVPATVPEPTAGPWRTLWHELTSLERLTRT